MFDERAIGCYEILGRLGRGAMGVVYRARDTRSGRTVALKTLDLPSESVLPRFRREIRVLQRIHHPGIVRILDHGIAEGLPWYAMEIIEATMLNRYCRELRPPLQPPSPPALALGPGAGAEAVAGAIASPPSDAGALAGWLRELLGVFRRMCLTLAYLHGEGVVHRDLKPPNILVQANGFPVLVDFGLISTFEAAQSRASFELSGRALGTVAYMAPEQIRGELVDARSDLYAVGCLLYEAATGRRPFPGDDVNEVLKCHLSCEPEPPRAVRSDLPAELERLVLRLLAKDPAERLGFASDVAAALGDIGAAMEPGIDAAGANLPEPKTYLYRSRFFGRDGTLDRLRGALGIFASEPGRLVLVSGESGSGKTRLVMEIARDAHRKDILVLGDRCRERASSPLAPIRGILQFVADRCRDRGEEVARHLLGRRAAVLSLYEPSLRNVPGVDFGAEPAQLSPAAAQLRVLRYLAETLAALAEERPLLLVLDDLQWADELTLGALRWCVRSGLLERAAVAIAATYRREEVSSGLAALTADSGVVHLALDRLDDEAITAIAADMIALRPPPERLAAYLARHAEGNPFFVAEYLRAAVSENLLWRDRSGQWRFARALLAALSASEEVEALPIPLSVQGLVQGRLDQLSPAARELGTVLSVVGRTATVVLLWEIARAAEQELMDRLAELLSAQVLEETEPGQMRFIHDEFRKQLRAALSPAGLRELEARIATGIERLFGEDDPSQWAGLGTRWEAAGDVKMACKNYLRAARHAISRLAPRQAEKLYGAYLALADPLTEEHVRARVELAEGVHSFGGRLEEARSILLVALRDARALGAPEPVAFVLLAMGRILTTLGRYEEAHGLLEEALELQRRAGDEAGEAATLNQLGVLYFAESRLAEARAHYEMALEIRRHAGDARGVGRILGNIAGIHYRTGNLEDAIDYLNRDLAIERSAGDRIGEAVALANIALMLAEQGQLHKALLLFHQCHEIHEETGDRQSEAAAAGNIGLIYERCGDLDEAESWFRRALALMRELGTRDLEANTLGNLAGLLCMRGEMDVARRVYGDALAMFVALGNGRGQAEVHGQIAELTAEVGDLEAAHEHLRAALELARKAGDRRLEGGVLVQASRFERRCRSDLERAERLVQRALEVADEVADRPLRVLGWCEASHLQLARGQSAARSLAAARAALAEVRGTRGSELAAALRRAEDASQASQEGSSPKLFAGELRRDLPAGMNRWLERRTEAKGAMTAPAAKEIS